jgi:hypothetical protein
LADALARGALFSRPWTTDKLWVLEPFAKACLLLKGGDPAAPSDTATLLRLHPSHESHRGERPPRKVKLPTSGETHSHGVTGGVYKTRERIHRGMLIHDY